MPLKSISSASFTISINLLMFIYDFYPLSAILHSLKLKNSVAQSANIFGNKYQSVIKITLPVKFRISVSSLYQTFANRLKPERKNGQLFLNDLLFLSSETDHSKKELCGFHSVLYRNVNTNSRDKSCSNNKPG